MRIPWWLRNRNLVEIKRRVDQVVPDLIDRVDGLEKLPLHYQKAYMEGRTKEPRSVHYVPATKTHIYDAEHGKIMHVDETQSIKPRFPPEADYGLWGGEGIIKGFTKRTKRMERATRWWFPPLRQVAFYSEILDKHMLIVVTDSTMDRIDEAHGFDYFILKTHAADLKSRLGMRLKGEMIRALEKETLYPHDPDRRDQLLEKYKEFIVSEEEADWVGLSLAEAVRKQNKEQYRPPVPLKEVFRDQFLLELQKRKRGELNETNAKNPT